MSLSELQKSLLRAAYRYARSRVPRQAFRDIPHARARANHQAEILGRSLERLVDRGLLVAYGHRTSEKWFIEAVRLTPAGRRTGRQLLGHQTTLPLT